MNEDWLKAFVEIYSKYYELQGYEDVSEEEDPQDYAEYLAIQTQGMSYISENSATVGLEGEALEAARKKFADFSSDLTKKITGAGEGEYGLSTEVVDTDAVRYVNQYERSYCPEHVVWDLTMRSQRRSVSSFYWLKAEKSLDKGLVNASFDRATNTFALMPSEDLAGDFSVLINPHMVDVSQPVHFNTPKGRFTVSVAADPKIIEDSLRGVCDPYLAWVQEVTYQGLESTNSDEADLAQEVDPASAPGNAQDSGAVASTGTDDAEVGENAKTATAEHDSSADPKEVPKTGDEMGLALGAGVLSFLALLALAVICLVNRARQGSKPTR